jgi:pyruvate/2-oxoglutarate dehydrogenase complex dihydrolipoamide dehydrogenase (E3) component
MPPIPTRIYDAIVIGSGQAGTPLATTLASAGKKTALVEKSHVGGCCINEGCTPTKTMIASGRVAYLTRRAADYGISDGGDGNVKIDMKKVKKRRDDIVDSFREGSEKRLVTDGVDLLMGEARFVAEKEVEVTMNDGGNVRCKAKWIFLNTGERPHEPDLSGLKEVKSKAPDRVLDSTSIQALEELPESLIVLGGGYIGLEFAQLYQRLGSKVTVVQRTEQLLPHEDPDLANCLRDILLEDGLDIKCTTEATHISTSEEHPVTLDIRSSNNGDKAQIHGSHILIATGRVPNTDTLNLPATGLSTNGRGYLKVNDELETTVPGIFALGDVKGPPAFTHISYDDFRIVRDNLGLLPHPSSSTLDKPQLPHSLQARKALIPYVVFTDPQLGHVGLHEHDIPADSPLRTSKRLKVTKMPMSYVARALEMDEARGMMKAVVDGETGQILGFSCLGIDGGEIMGVIQVAMMGGVKWWELREAVFAHPTLSESLNNLWGFLEDPK